MRNDDLHVVHAPAAGLDVHKLEITATVRLCATPRSEPTCETRTFSALASGLDAVVAWLTGHGVEAAALEGTGVYWHAPWRALAAAGIKAQLLRAQHVRQPGGRPGSTGVRRAPKNSSAMARSCSSHCSASSADLGAGARASNSSARRRAVRRWTGMLRRSISRLGVSMALLSISTHHHGQSEP